MRVYTVNKQDPNYTVDVLLCDGSCCEECNINTSCVFFCGCRADHITVSCRVFSVHMLAIVLMSDTYVMLFDVLPT